MAGTTTARAPGNQESRNAYQVLHLGFTVAPILFGLDKFFNLTGQGESHDDHGEPNRYSRLSDGNLVWHGVSAPLVSFSRAKTLSDSG